MRTAIIVCALGAICLPTQRAYAWGAAGHSIVAEIAQHRLEPDVVREIKRLLGGEVSLASVANWADTVESERHDTRNWHFVNIPVGAAAYDPARDCPQTPQGDCVVNAIARSHTTLADRHAAKAERANALMFLVHLVGDIHQPLHCADRNGDGGATTLLVQWFGKSMSLHLVWDVGLIEKRTYDWGDYVRYLERDWIAANLGHDLRQGTPADWAWESHRAAVDVAYTLPEDLKLGDDYYTRSRPIVERQLALAGVRLGRVLNDTLRWRADGRSHQPKR
jgi:nuclease S1